MLKWFVFIDRCYEDYIPMHQIIKLDFDTEDNFVSIILKTGCRLCAEVSKEQREELICFLKNEDSLCYLHNFKKESIIDVNYIEAENDDQDFIRIGQL